MMQKCGNSGYTLLAESGMQAREQTGFLRQEGIEVKNAWMMTASAVVLASVAASQGNAQTNAGTPRPTRTRLSP